MDLKQDNLNRAAALYGLTGSQVSISLDNAVKAWKPDAALVVVGDRKGKVGAGFAKAPDVRNAIRKAFVAAKKKMKKVTLSGTTIPYSVTAKYSAARVILKPAPAGSGIIAGGPMRVVLEAAGIKDAVGKILGTKNKISNVYATLKALDMVTKLSERKTNK